MSALRSTTGKAIVSAGLITWTGCPSTTLNVVRNASWRRISSFRLRSSTPMASDPRQGIASLSVYVVVCVGCIVRESFVCTEPTPWSMDAEVPPVLVQLSGVEFFLGCSDLSQRTAKRVWFPVVAAHVFRVLRASRMST